MDLQGARRDGAPWAAAGASMWVRRSLGARIALFGGVETLAVLARPRFELTDSTLVHRPAAVIGRLLVGIEVALDPRPGP
jgi:hypothetical protein